MKRKLQIKLAYSSNSFVFFFLFLTPSLSFIHLFYFISFILSFILFHFIKNNFFLFLFLFIYLFIFFLYFPTFPLLSSLFLTLQEVDMTALQFAGPSFPLSSSYHPSYYFYLLTPHPLILILTLFWGWHSCLTVCQSLNTYSFYFSTLIFYLILSLLKFQQLLLSTK